MTSDLAGDMILVALFLGGSCIILAVCGLLSRYVLKKSPKVEQRLFSLFGLDPDEFEDDNEEEGGVR